MARLGEDFPHAQLLVDAGYGTEARVRNASDEDLLAIEGIGPATLEKIRAALSAGKTEEGEAVVSHHCSNPLCGFEITTDVCPYCGQG